MKLQVEICLINIVGEYDQKIYIIFQAFDVTHGCFVLTSSRPRRVQDMHVVAGSETLMNTHYYVKERVELLEQHARKHIL